MYILQEETLQGKKALQKEFEIYASLKDEGDDFNLVSSGEYTESTRDLVEIKFNPTDFKRLKFKFKRLTRTGLQQQNLCFIKKIN